MDAEAIQDKLSVDTYNFTQTVYDIRRGGPVITHSKHFDATGDPQVERITDADGFATAADDEAALKYARIIDRSK